MRTLRCCGISQAVGHDRSLNERFRRLAATRGDRLIREISLVGNLANRRNYEYSLTEVVELFGPIEDELRDASRRSAAGSQGWRAR